MGETQTPTASPESSPEPSAERTSSTRLQRVRGAFSSLSFGRFFEVFGIFGQMWVALWGGDAPSRRMALLFFLSLGLLATAMGLTYERYMRHRQLYLRDSAQFAETSKNLGEFIQKQADTAKHKFSTLPLGRFSVELKISETDHSLQGAEIEIVVECDSKETRYLIEENMPRVRDQITGVLLPIEREELMTAEGKKRLKKKVMDRINNWLPSGHVTNLFFSDVILN